VSTEKAAKSPKQLTGFFLKYREAIFMAAYVIVLCAVKLPDMVWGYDVGHQDGLLTQARLVLAGQVPYRDFYAWYGPLYHYLFALALVVLGADLYSVKFYLDIVNPVLCIGILILVLRIFRFSFYSRIFVFFATVLFGLERMYNSGALRSFLPLLFMAIWHLGWQRRQKALYLAVFPLTMAMFFYSSDGGAYLAPSTVAYLAFAVVMTPSRKEQKDIIVWSSLGLAACLLFSIVCFFFTDWFGNYLHFISNMNKYFIWYYGMTTPGLGEIGRHPLAIFYYLPLMIFLMVSAALMTKSGRNYMVSGQRIYLPALLFYLLLSWHRILGRTSPGHLMLCFLPAVIAAAVMFDPDLEIRRPFKSAAKLLLVIMLLPGTLFFIPLLSPQYQGEPYEMLMGVRVSPEQKRNFDIIARFTEGKDFKQIYFPFKAFYYCYFNVARFPFYDPGWLIVPEYRREYLGALQKWRPENVIITLDDITWMHPGAAVDPVLDYFDANYQLAGSQGSVGLFQIRSAPRAIYSLVAKTQTISTLDRTNNFTASFQVPARPGPGFCEIEMQFYYPNKWMQRFTKPMVECAFDRRPWTFYRPNMGRQRIDRDEGGLCSYRLYLFYPVREITFQVTFPGAFNARPSKITIRGIKWFEPLVSDLTPRMKEYDLQ